MLSLPKNIKVPLVINYVWAFFLSFNIHTIYAQQYVPINKFTTQQGLPSNHIYEITQDKKGFIWIATDNGVSRFDGKYFTNFSVKDGLPSNDAIQIKRTKDGTIWVNCYRQAPCYFEEQKNKFISFDNNKIVHTKLSALLLIQNWDADTIEFTNSLCKLFFSNKKLVAINHQTKNVIKINADKNSTILNFELKNNIITQQFIKANHIISVKYNSSIAKTLNYKNVLYNLCTDNNKIYVLSKIHTPLDFIKIDSIQLNGQLLNINFSQGQIQLIYKDNKMETLELNSLKCINVTNNKESYNCIFKDANNNEWRGTLDNGIIYCATSNIKIVELSEKNIDNNFLNITTTKNKKIYASNYSGHILNIKDSKKENYNLMHENKQVQIRKLLAQKNNVMALTDNYYNTNFLKNITIYNKYKGKSALKTMTCVNDTTIMIGTINGIYQLQTNTYQYKEINAGSERIIDIIKKNDTEIFFINTNGLNQYNMITNTYTAIEIPINEKDEKPNLLLYTPDSILWIVTSKGNLLALHNNTMHKIKQEIGLPENTTNIIACENKIWLSSKTGICIITYNHDFKNFKYSISNISKMDGLPSNIVNEAIQIGDSIYAATENGIAIIPKNIKTITQSISPELIGIKINQEQLPIRNNYTLKASQTNLLLTFAGIDVSGHFKNFEYAIDDSTIWAMMDANIINIQLSTGAHQIFVRCRDANNIISKKILILTCNIDTPFYKTIWFGIILSILATALSLLMYNRRKLLQQKIIFEKQLALEQQRNKLTADLHDDIGATLSSLQVNSAIAYTMVTKNIKGSEKIIEKIEYQSKELSEKIGDIIWSMKPGKDEFMNISSRIKNFANDILSATNIDYKINIDEEINKLVLDISARKNIVFITKEAINNIVKYSNANSVSISLVKYTNKLLLTIADDGQGFDASITAGNGINNMRNRALELNGAFDIQSNNKGSSIEVIIPISQN